MKRRLFLSKDVLAELSTDELHEVAGAAATIKDLCGPLSFAPGCVRPTCGPGCTAVSDPVTK